MVRLFPARTTAALMLGALSLAACSDAPTALRSSASAPLLHEAGTPTSVADRAPDVGEFEVCADGLTATFTVVATPLGFAGAPITTNPTIAAGTCQIVHTNSLDNGRFYDVTVTQTNPATPTSLVCSVVDPIGSATCGGNKAQYAINVYHGALAIFTNAASVPKGCTYTQGWYKNQGSSSIAGKYLNGTLYLTVLNTPPKGNVYYILAHQYIAASMNAGKIGGSPVSAQLAAAATYFSKATPANPLPAGYTTSSVTALANTLDSFNNGNYAGYPHCS